MKFIVYIFVMFSCLNVQSQIITAVSQQQKNKSEFPYVTGVDSARIIIVGASIMLNTFLTPSETVSLINAEYPTKYVELYNEAINGADTDEMQTSIDGILSDYTFDAELPTYVVVHIGGNDVTDNRPYSGDVNLGTMESNIEYILDAIEAKGFIPILNDLSFRNYSGTTYSNESAGSLPYNTNILQPLILSRTANYAYSDGQSHFQLYTFLYNNYDIYLSGDNVHPNTTGYTALRTRFVNSTCKFIFTGIAPTKIEKE